MDTLEDYLTNEYHADLRDIRDTEELLASVLTTFTKTFSKSTAWPYALQANSKSAEPTIISQSTTAMILGALMRLRGQLKTSVDELNSSGLLDGDLARVPLPSALEKTLDIQISDASKVLLDAVFKDGDSRLETKSKTFGVNDVFTLAWLTELTKANWTKIIPPQPRWPVLQKLAFESAEKKLEKWKSGATPPHFYKPPAQTKAKPLNHAFPPLRLVQAIRRIKGSDYGALSDRYRYFETNLHDQLSYSSIPDSRFDPAELMFCLEGMLLCQKNVVDRSLFDRVLAVLTDAQRENAYWRPTKPYLATDQGLVLFPICVEVANSLVRACFIIDGDRVHDTYISKCIGLLRRYWQWLRARTVRFKDSLEFVGWHSEHVNEPTVIHLWETSQVIEFLFAYRIALKLHIARTTLVRSCFKYEGFPATTWRDIQDANEPVTALGTGLQIYKGIGESFISRGESDRNYSMLLYGPPGTGKTTIAKSIAAVLRRRLVTITVSDFLAGGGGQIEARAKNIFDVLLAQPGCVVLFDELDHFLLDRDSDRYSKQDTVFQFMTPGMLTKLNDLRSSEDAIFVIATNYEDRIDAAIKRTGRIDKRYLVLPPDRAGRKKFLSQFLGADITKTILTDEWARLEIVSLFLGFTDIKQAVRQWKQQSSKTIASLEKLLEDAARTASFAAYTSRFERDQKPLDARETPMSEFICLIALHLETGQSLELREETVIGKAAKVLAASEPVGTPPAVTTDRVSEMIPELDRSIAENVAKCLNACAAKLK